MQDNFSVKNWKNTVLYEQDFKQELDIYGYQTQHFDMCPGAQNLYKRIMAGDFTDGMPSVKEQEVLIRLAKLHDKLFGMEKIALSSKDGVSKEFADKSQEVANRIMELAKELDLTKEHGYIQQHVDVIKDKINEMAIILPEQEDDIELEIPGDESSATVDKKVQAKATRQDKIIKDFQRIQSQMKTHLELYKTSESEENKKTALQMLKNLTPEFQAAKKKYEKLKGVKV